MGKESKSVNKTIIKIKRPATLIEVIGSLPGSAVLCYANSPNQPIPGWMTNGSFYYAIVHTYILYTFVAIPLFSLSVCF